MLVMREDACEQGHTVLPSQVFYEPKTALKKTSIKKKRCSNKKAKIKKVNGTQK